MKQLILSMLMLLIAGSVFAEYPRPQQALNGKYGYYSPTGAVEIRPRFDNALDFREGFAPVEMRGKWGFINLQGRFIAKCKYQEVRDFNYGYAAVCYKNLWGVIDTEGNEVVPCIFENIGDLVDMKSVIERYTPVIGKEAQQMNEK